MADNASPQVLTEEHLKGQLRLVDRVELRILQLEDKDFSSALRLYLVPLLEKLQLNYVELSTRILQVLAHISRRFTEDTEVPIERLCELFAETNGGSGLGYLRQNIQVLKFIRLGLSSRAISSRAEFAGFLAVGLGAAHTDDSGEFRVAVLGEQFSLFLLCLNDWNPNFDTEPPQVSGRDVQALEEMLMRFFWLDYHNYPDLRAPGLGSQDQTFYSHCSKVGVGSDEALYTRTRRQALAFALSSPEQYRNVLLAAAADRAQDIATRARKAIFQNSRSPFGSVPTTSEWTVDFCLGYNSAMLIALALGGPRSRAVSNDVLVIILEILTRQKISLDTAAAGELITRAVESSDVRLRCSALLLLESTPSTGNNNQQFLHLAHQIILDQGWPQSHVTEPRLVTLRQRCFEVLGTLQRRDALPELTLFMLQSLEREDASVAPSVQKGLSDALSGVKDTSEIASRLLHFLKSSSSPRIAFVAVGFASQQLQTNDPVRVLILLLGLISRSDVAESARIGLRSAPYPTFSSMLSAIKADIWPLNSATQADGAIEFLGRCLVADSGGLVGDLHLVIKRDVRTREGVQAFCSNHSSEVRELLSLCLSVLLSGQNSGDRQSDVGIADNTFELWRSILPLAPSSARPSALTDECLVGMLSGQYASLAAETLSIMPDIDLHKLGDQIPGGYLAASYVAASRSLRGEPVDPATVKRISDYAVAKREIKILSLLAMSGLLPDPSDEMLSVMEGDAVAIASLRLSDSKNMVKYASMVLGGVSSDDAKAFDSLIMHGEAVAVLVSGYGRDSSSLLRQRYPMFKFPTALEDTLEQIWPEIWPSKSSPIGRRISAVRLLCLVQYSWAELEFHSKLSVVQSALMQLLQFGDELTQESASRALGILFEQGSPEIRSQLTEGLVNSFTADALRDRPHLSESSEIFQRGRLRIGEDSERSNDSGNTGSSSVSTYRDVLRLAADVGDSSLVYKFLSLAASSQVWNSRRGAAFGLERIVARSELAQEIAAGSEHGRRLVPRLFRYQFDPNTHVQRAMASIWQALVPRPQDTLSLYTSELVSQLLSEATESREWRVREAAASALESLVETHWSNLSPWAPEIWTAAFRAVDDVKDSVRSAGTALAKALSKSLLRRLEKRLPAKSDEHVLNQLIPFLLGTRGIQASSEDVRSSSLDTLLQIMRTGAPALKLQAPRVIQELCLQLSSLESQAANYLTLHSENLDVPVTVIDEKRQQALRQSPLVEALVSMVERVDSSQFGMLVGTVLPATITESTGFASEIVAAELSTLACMRFSQDADFTSLLRACVAKRSNVNVTVAMKYSDLFGYICRHVPLSVASKQLRQLHVQLTAGDDDTGRKRLIVAKSLEAMSRHSSSRFMDLASSSLPLAFLGRFFVDQNYPELSHSYVKEAATIFEEVWTSNTGGVASIKLYRKEIIDLAIPLLREQERSIQRAAALSLLTVVNSDHCPQPELASMLANAVQCRSWPGKEYVFVALMTVAVDTPSLDPAVARVSVQEIQRRNKDYREKILPSVGRFLAAHPSSEVASAFITAASDLMASNDTPVDVKEALIKSASLSRVPEFAAVFDNAWDHWQLRRTACAEIANLARAGIYSQTLWQLALQHCANDDTSEVVRQAWARAAVALKPFGVEADVREAAKHEPSKSVREELSLGYSGI